MSQTAVVEGDDVVLFFDKQSRFDFRDQASVRLRGRREGAYAGMVVAASRGNTQKFIIASDNVDTLLGVAPLLRVTPSADENVGSFAAADGPSLWQLTSSSVRLGDRVRIDLGGPGYLLKHPGAPVAVLTGPRTASSGEATVLSFRGRPQTRSFGQPTSGLSTANVMRPLADGSALLLTTSVMRDRNDRGDGLKIEPDQRVEGDAATVAAAQAWLLAQPACQVNRT